MSKAVERVAAFRGSLMPVVEISKITGMHPESVWYRARKGLDLDATGTAANGGRAARDYHDREQDSLFDDDLPYEHDLRAQIAVALVVARGRPATLEEVGKCMGVCRERARQIENEALRKVRQWATRNGEMQRLRELFELREELRQPSTAERMDLASLGFDNDDQAWRKPRIRAARRRRRA